MAIKMPTRREHAIRHLTAFTQAAPHLCNCPTEPRHLRDPHQEPQTGPSRTSQSMAALARSRMLREPSVNRKAKSFRWLRNCLIKLVEPRRIELLTSAVRLQRVRIDGHSVVPQGSMVLFVRSSHQSRPRAQIARFLSLTRLRDRGVCRPGRLSRSR